MMFAISTTSSDTSSVMIVMTTRISTSVKPFLRLIAPPFMASRPPVRSARLLVLDAPRRGRRGRRPLMVAPRAPHVEAAGMQHGRAARRRGPGARSGARPGRHGVVAVVDPVRGRIAFLAPDRVHD